MRVAESEVTLLKKQVRIRVTDNLHAKLHNYALIRGVPVAHVVREAIVDYLRRRRF